MSQLQVSIEGEKNFLGRYKHQLAKDWSILLKLYEYENTHRAERAKRLQQMTSYDLPALKKHQTSLIKT